MHYLWLLLPLPLVPLLVDVLQAVGVTVGDAVAYAVDIVKDRVPISVVSTDQSYNPTFFEIVWPRQYHAGFARMSQELQCEWT